MGALLSDQEGIILVDKRKYNIWIMGLAKATETPLACKAVLQKGNQKWERNIILV